MAQTTSGVRAVLSHPRVYWATQVVFGARKRQANFVGDHLRPSERMRVLDIGCGPGEMIELLPSPHYLGIDLSPRYIEAARRRFGRLGAFQCGDAAAIDLQGRRFEAVIADGLLHHLDDERATRALALAAGVLEDGGRMLTMDPVRVDGTSPIVDWLIARDRGQAVRTPDGYSALARRSFSEVSITIENPRLPIPPFPRYPVAVLECRFPHPL